MISLGNRWKEFKSKLYREFHLQNKDEVAREKYHIPLHVWDEFVRQRSTPEFLVRSSVLKVILYLFTDLMICYLGPL